MTYLQARNDPGKRRARAVAIIAIVLLAAVALIHRLRPHFFPSLFTSFVRPFWRAEVALSLGALKSPEALLQENEHLKRELEAAAVRLETIRSVEEENRELKALLGRASTTSYIAAAVLKRPPAAPYDELIIDAGADQKFSVDDEVFAPGNVPIGRITEVLGETSKVILYSSPGSRYDVLIGPLHAPATAVGRGGGHYAAELPRDVKLVKGDMAIAPSFNDKPFATVISVIADPTEPFETVLLAPPVNPYSLRWVLVDSLGERK